MHYLENVNSFDLLYIYGTMRDFSNVSNFSITYDNNEMEIRTDDNREITLPADNWVYLEDEDTMYYSDDHIEIYIMR